MVLYSRFEKLNTIEISGWQIESVAESDTPKIIYSSIGEIGMFSLSLRVDGMREGASLLKHVTAENLLMIMAVGFDLDTIYQVRFISSFQSSIPT